MEAVQTVAGLLRSAQLLHQLLADHYAEFGLTEIRCDVLRLVAGAADRGITQHELATALRQSESSISTLIDRMRKDGLVYRIAHPHDRRRKQLLLSPKGRELLERVEAAHPQAMAALWEGMDDAEVSALRTLLARVEGIWAARVEARRRFEASVSRAA